MSAFELPALSIITVLRVPEPKVPPPVFGVPLPVSVIPVEMESPLVQVQVPAGIVTVSPTAAEAIAVCTSDKLQEAAACVAACAVCPESALNKSVIDVHLIFMVGAPFLSKLIIKCGSNSIWSRMRSRFRGRLRKDYPYKTTKSTH